MYSKVWERSAECNWCSIHEWQHEPPAMPPNEQGKLGKCKEWYTSVAVKGTYNTRKKDTRFRKMKHHHGEEARSLQGRRKNLAGSTPQAFASFVIYAASRRVFLATPCENECIFLMHTVVLDAYLISRKVVRTLMAL